MRAFLTLSLLFLLAFSANAFEIKNDSTSLGLSNKIDCSTGINCTLNKVSGITTMTTVGALETVVESSTASILSTQCGSTFVNTATSQFELPEASTVIGCTLTFVTGATSTLVVNPDDADQILVETNAVGDAISNATNGNSIMLQAISASEWAPLSNVGTWADAN